jgi:4,5-dihydroxyphthalate decarboxylase
MAKLRLTLACGEYEITRALTEGKIQPEGIELIPLTMPSPERHWRMIRHQEFDVCEFSMCNYLVSKAKGESLMAIPVFPHRRFRHSYVFVNTQAGIKRPKDLEGKRVGLRTTQNTAGLWMRGILQHYHGVSLKEIQWIIQDEEPISLGSREGLPSKRVAPDENIDDLLIKGELEAVIYPDTLPSFSRGDTAVKRLFTDPKKEEMRYYRDTGIFPIMHTVVIKGGVIDQYPWVAKNLWDAFQKAKEMCYRRMEDPRKIALAWVMHHLEEQKQILGHDPWVYGLTHNRNNLETLITYAYEQGLIHRKVELGELFIQSASDQGPQYLVELKS